MSGKKIKKGSISRGILLVLTYLCFVAELAFIIMGFTSYGIVFAGLRFCLVIVFFVLWRGERAHELLALRSSLDEVLHRESMGNTRREHEQMRRLRKEKEDLACEKEQAESCLEKLVQEKEMLTRQLAEAQLWGKSIPAKEEAAGILPPDENPVDLDLSAVFSYVTSDMEDSCGESGIRLRLSCSNEMPSFRADERYVRLILYNIIDNSIKYMKCRGSLVITLSYLGNSFFLAFKDDGMGLAQKEIAHIFDLNFQGSNRVSGSGLGLAQVKAIVGHYGGSVNARSTDGMGIYIQLPASREL